MSPEDLQKVTFVQMQTKETVQQEKNNVTIRMGTITCRCGCQQAVVHMYRCLYCKEWYCLLCAEEHFGKTVTQYKKERKNA